MSDFLATISDLLRRSPELLRVQLAGLPDDWVGTPDVDGGWRPREVVGHLVTGELTDWMPRAEIILDHGTARPFEPFDRFIHLDRDAKASLDELVDRFAALRRENLERLAARVTDADLDRRGRHPSLGEVTLRQLLASWAVHDLDHVAQVFAALAGSHADAVGPWKAYLGILLRRDDPSAVPG